MPAQIQRDDSIIKRELLQLVMPLFCLSPKPVNENKCPLGMLGRDVNCRKPDQRSCRNAHVVTIPGAAFGRSGEGCLRLSFGSVFADDLVEGLNRLEDYFEARALRES